LERSARLTLLAQPFYIAPNLSRSNTFPQQTHALSVWIGRGLRREKLLAPTTGQTRGCGAGRLTELILEVEKDFTTYGER